jgi:hypothetical protein
MATELMLEKLRSARLKIELPSADEYPDGRIITIRSVHTIPTGKPFDPRRADDPDTYAKTGLWFGPTGCRQSFWNERNLHIRESRVTVATGIF